MSEKSFELFSKEHSSSEKFDYFICSVAGALFAYIGQTYTPHTFDSWFYCLTPVALLFLTLCFGCGLILIGMSTEITRLNKEIFVNYEESEIITHTLNNSKSPAFIDKKTGEDVTRESMQKQRSQKIEEAKKLENEAYSKMDKSKYFIIARNVFLGLGFILILLSKVLQPYFATK